jgi:hypothetical protein
MTDILSDIEEIEKEKKLLKKQGNYIGFTGL